MLELCPHFSDTRRRLEGLHAREAMDQVFAVMNTPSAALDDFARRHREGYCDYPDPAERLAFWEAHLSRKAAIEDDGVPSAYLTECDQGLYGGLVGGRVHYMAHPGNGWISSMVAPILEHRTRPEDLKVDLESPAWTRYIEQLDLFHRGARGRFGISHFILIDAMNFIFELFGATEAYRIMLFEPDYGQALCRFALDLNRLVQDRFFEHGLLAGGTCSNMAQWLPGRVISESVDPYHMTSAGDFERWGRRWVEEIFAHYDGGVIHIHGNGRHLLPAVSGLAGLKAIWLGDDRGYPRSFEILGELRALTGDVPLIVHCGFGEFRAALDRQALAGGVIYEVTEVPDVPAANRLMERVRAYRL